MGVKCPKKTISWVHFEKVLIFLKENRRRLMTFTEENHAGMVPTDSWWTVTYAIAPAINAINITFALMQNRSLLLAQQGDHIMVLVATIKTMFEIKLIDQDDADAVDDDEFVRFKTMRVRTDHLVTLIEDEGSMARD